MAIVYTTKFQFGPGDLCENIVEFAGKYYACVYQTGNKLTVQESADGLSWNIIHVSTVQSGKIFVAYGRLFLLYYKVISNAVALIERVGSSWTPALALFTDYNSVGKITTVPITILGGTYNIVAFKISGSYVSGGTQFYISGIYFFDTDGDILSMLIENVWSTLSPAVDRYSVIDFAIRQVPGFDTETWYCTQEMGLVGGSNQARILSKVVYDPVPNLEYTLTAPPASSSYILALEFFNTELHFIWQLDTGIGEFSKLGPGVVKVDIGPLKIFFRQFIADAFQIIEFDNLLFFYVLEDGAPIKKILYSTDGVTISEDYSADITAGWGTGIFSLLDGGLCCGVPTKFIEANNTVNPPPPPVTVFNTLLEVPFLNSISFVVDPVSNPDLITEFQQLDNVLFCNQFFPGYSCTEYYQKIMIADSPLVQFYSDFGNHTATLHDYYTDEQIKEFTPISLVEQNLGLQNQYTISLRAHTGFPTKTRVYFAVGNIPIPLNIGDQFDVANNAEGMNGTYLIAAIGDDPILNQQYLIINLIYSGAGASSPADGLFSTDFADFNVYEFSAPFNDVPEGEYYIKIRAYSDDELIEKIAISEPIELRTKHPKTNLVEYRNYDNSYGVTWSTGYQGQMRIPSVLFKRLPGGERKTSRNSDFSLVKTNAKKIRGFMFQTYMLPPYLHEKLSCAFDCDEWYINKVRHQSNEGYDEPQYLEEFKLANSQIKIEQYGWFDRYNSNDISSVNDGLIEIQDGGFLKR